EGVLVTSPPWRSIDHHQGYRPGMVDRRLRHFTLCSQGRLTESPYTFGIRSVQGKAGEELRRHATATTRIEMRASRARTARCRRSHLGEEIRMLPDRRETAVGQHVSGKELLVDGERAGVHVADRVDQTHHPACAAEVQTRQRLPERGQVE